MPPPAQAALPAPSITIDIQDNSGNFRQYCSSNTGSFTNTYLKFVPPVPVSTVRFMDFIYTNGGSGNTMDFFINGLPGATNTSIEGWSFVDAALNPVGYAFTSQAQCVAQGNGSADYHYTVGPPAFCSRDYLTPGAPVAPYNMNQSVSLSALVPNFNMALTQGCGSTLTGTASDGEQFHIATPPGAGGVWQTGILVR